MPNPSSLSGRTAIVTGAAQGIGKAIVEAFVEADAQHVVAADIREEPLQALAAEHGQVSAATLDVTDEGGWQALAAQTVAVHGGVDILVNNAGILVFGLLEDTPVADFRRVLEVNVTGAFLGIQAVAKIMKEAGRGVIVNTASVSGILPNNAIGAYAASKFALRGLTRSAALELGPFGVRVNSVHPGGVNTPLANPTNITEAEFDERHKFVPLQRGSRPSEIAQGVLYLASDAGGYCSGTELVIDGGMTAGIYFEGLPGSLN